MYAHVRIFHCIQMTQTLCCLCAEILRFKNSGPARKKQKFTFRILGNPPEVTLSENPRVSVSFLDGRRGQKPWKPSKNQFGCKPPLQGLVFSNTHVDPSLFVSPWPECESCEEVLSESGLVSCSSARVWGTSWEMMVTAVNVLSLRAKTMQSLKNYISATFVVS